MLDTETTKQNTIYGGKSGLYGISWDKNNIYVTSEAIHNHVGISVFNNDFVLIDNIKIDGLVHPHQIVVNHGVLWIVNTGKDTLVSYNLSSGQTEEYNLPDTGGNFSDQNAKNHFNSILFKDDLMYVCAHNGQNGSVVLVLDDEMNEIYRIRLGKMLHNISYKDEIMACSSGMKRITTIGKTICSSNDFLRGLVHTNNEIVFGASWIGERSERKRKNGGASINILKDGLVKTFGIENSGQIMDIRVLDKFDYAHGVEPFL